MSPHAHRVWLIAGAFGSAALLGTAACAHGPLPPADLDTRNDACAFCRMGVVDRRFAAQIVAPGEEPLFFDDIGCLRDYLARAARVPGGAVAYVSDHRTRRWVPAATAIYARVPGLQTPMGSGLIAHANAESKSLDEEARDAAVVMAAQIFGPRGVPGGAR